jgi:hypothetical protein
MDNPEKLTQAGNVETTAVILAETSERKKTKTRSEVSNDQADKRQMNQVRKSFNR